MKPIYSSAKLHLKKQNSPSLRTSKSINLKLPEPTNYAQKINMMQQEIVRLNESLIYYRNKSESNSQILNENAVLRNDNENQKSIVRTMSEQLIFLKRKNESQQQLRHKNIAQIKELSKEINDYKREVESLNNELQKLRRQNGMDRMGKRSLEYYSYEQKFRNRQSTIMKNSRALSDLELLEGERFGIKLAEKNKEYEQLYRKYQSLQNDYTEMEETNTELERERKLLSEKLGRVQIHTQGDEADELQQKMALMSSEMMRLKNLSQTKTHEARELNMKVKQLILQKQNLQKEIIEKDKILLNYKQQLRLVELQLAEQIDSTQFREDQFLNEVREDNVRLKQENQHWSRSHKETIEISKNTEDKNRVLKESNERLAQQNRDLQRQCRRLNEGQQKYRQSQAKMVNLQAETNYLQQANHNIKLQVEHLQNTIQQLMREKGSISKEKEKVQQLSIKFESNVSILQGELKKVRFRLDDKENQLKQVNNRFSEKIMIKSNEIRLLQEKTHMLQQQIERGSKNRLQVNNYEQVLREAQQLERSSMILKQQLHQYQEQIALLAQQNERLSERLKNQKQSKTQLNGLKSELEQKSRREWELTKQISSVAMKQKVAREEIQLLREKIRLLEMKEKDIDSYEFKNRQLTDQLDGLRTLLTVKQDEVLNLQRYFQTNPNKRSSYFKNEEVDKNNKFMFSQEDMQNKNRIESQLRLLQDEQLRDKGYIKQLQQKEEENNQNYRILSEQIGRLNSVLEDKSIQNLQFKKDNDLLYHKVKTCQDLLEQRKITEDSFAKIQIQKQHRTKIQFYEGTIRKYESDLQLLGQRYQNLKEESIRQEARITVLTNQKLQQQQKVRELDFQLGDRSQHFRRVEQSFRMTISQIKSSNQRLEQSVKQIQTYYISKYEQKQYQCDQLRKQRQQLQGRVHELQKSILTSNEAHNLKIREKQQYINNINSNHYQIKEETEIFKRMKNQYEAKLALLSQQLQRLNGIKQSQTDEIERLRQYNYENSQRFNQSMRQSTVNVHSIETLSEEIERLNTVLSDNVQKLRIANKKVNMFEIEKAELTREKQQEVIYRKQLYGEFQQYKKIKEAEMRQLRDQLNENIQKCKQWEEKIKRIQERGQRQIIIKTQNANEEIRKIADSNLDLEDQLQRVSREYQYLLVQWEQLKKMHNSSEQDQKIRIMNNYQSTIQQIKKQNSVLQEQRTKLQIQCSQLNKISHELQEKLRTAEQFKTIIQRQKEQLMSKLDRMQRNSEARKPQTDNLHKNNLFLSKQGNSINATDQLLVRTGNNSQDIEHRYILLESINKKLTIQMQCMHKTNVQYEFKMNKLKEEFTLLNRLVKEYREENDNLKQKNKGQHGNTFANTYSNFRSPQRGTVLQVSHKNNLSPPPVLRSDNADGIRSKLFQQIDRLNRVNISLQNEVHDLRLLSTDNLSLRKRLQENAALMVLLFVQIEALRLRLRQKGIGINSPRKSGINN